MCGSWQAMRPAVETAAGARQAIGAARRETRPEPAPTYAGWREPISPPEADTSYALMRALPILEALCYETLMCKTDETRRWLQIRQRHERGEDGVDGFDGWGEERGLVGVGEEGGEVVGCEGTREPGGEGFAELADVVVDVVVVGGIGFVFGEEGGAATDGA